MKRLLMVRRWLPGPLLALAACGAAPVPAPAEDAGAHVRTTPGGKAPSEGPNCVLDLQCRLVEESCPCRCRLNTEPAGLSFPNVVCAAVLCEACDGRVAFCDHRTFTCQQRDRSAGTP